MTTFAVIPQAYAVSNAAGTSHAVRNTTKNPADGSRDCTADQCILMSSDGVANNDNHGIFVKARVGGRCSSPFAGVNGGQYVVINSAMTSTAISTLTFGISGSGSSLCTTANTWHIFKTTTGNTIWAVKLSGTNFPTTLDATNLINCDPAGTFNTTTGCTPLTSSPPVNAPIDLNMNKPVETFATEIEIK